MLGKTRNALLGYGLNTDLIEKIAQHNYTVESLRSATKPKLAETFTEDEIEIVKARIERAPILDGISSEVVRKAAYRWEDLTKAPVSPSLLLSPRRYGDGAKDLWTTLNCVQENIIRGG
jgi:hypothetical protein